MTSERARLLVLAAAFALANVGIWNAGVPLGDEGIHVMQALRLLQGGSSLNPYYLAYAGLLAGIAPDPIVAHLVLRVAAAFGSMLGLYALLRAFPLRPWAAVLAALAWGVSALAMPSTQGGNNSIFCLALVLPALAWLLHRPSFAASAAFALAAFWAAQVRPEYYAALLLVPLWGIWAALRSGNRNFYGAIGLLALLAGSMAVTAGRGAGPGMDAYLLLGLGQCYAVFYQREHPQAQFHPMTEYQQVLDEAFNHPRTFSEALANNPREAARYFALNGLHNLGQLALKILKGNNDLRSLLILLLAAGGTVLGVRQWRPAPVLARLAALVLFALTSSVALVLLNDDPRYWVSFVPLAYVFLAWAIQQLLLWRERGRLGRAVLVGAFVILALPTFLLKHSNRDIILAIRESVAGLGRPPVLAGNFVSPLAAFAFAGRASAVNLYDGFDPAALRAGRYDVVVFDALDATALWKANRPFFEAFVGQPQAFGYRLLPGSKALGDVYVRDGKASG